MTFESHRISKWLAFGATCDRRALQERNCGSAKLHSSCSYILSSGRLLVIRHQGCCWLSHFNALDRHPPSRNGIPYRRTNWGVSKSERTSQSHRLSVALTYSILVYSGYFFFFFVCLCFCFSFLFCLTYNFKLFNFSYTFSLFAQFISMWVFVVVVWLYFSNILTLSFKLLFCKNFNLLFFVLHLKFIYFITMLTSKFSSFSSLLFT